MGRLQRWWWSRSPRRHFAPRWCSGDGRRVHTVMQDPPRDRQASTYAYVLCSVHGPMILHALFPIPLDQIVWLPARPPVWWMLHRSSQSRHAVPMLNCGLLTVALSSLPYLFVPPALPRVPRRADMERLDASNDKSRRATPFPSPAYPGSTTGSLLHSTLGAKQTSRNACESTIVICTPAPHRLRALPMPARMDGRPSRQPSHPLSRHAGCIPPRLRVLCRGHEDSTPTRIPARHRV